MPQLEEGNSEATSTPTPVPARVVPPIRTTPAPLALVLASPTNSNPESPSINPAIRVSPGNPVVHTPAGPNPTPLGLSGLLNPQPDGPSYPTYPTDDDTEDWDWLTDDDIGNESELSDDPREDGSEPEGGTENDEGSEGEESSGNGEDSDADENNESDQDRDFNSSDSDPEYDSDICRSCYWTTDSGSECATDMDDDPDPEPHPCPTPTAEITVYPSWYTPPPDPNDDLPPLEEIILPIGSYKNLLSNVMPPVGHDAKGVERKEGEEGSASRDGKERNEWNEDPFQQWLKWWVRLVRPQGGEEDLEG
ncbi:hypothetical protein P154DRAFT_522758 [Amniculicola lignicola CBS 123094]|uniref:Uncharacterized protein n=1 Tax=Amniculicola lignicola CBS 123094 TaxID=1392246 RepID=A0A6A5WF97_9PLEO|nr:hypothetical protein P154DRAFT_522758 [Amniculicola lignicola CBS 123094]